MTLEAKSKIVKAPTGQAFASKVQLALIVLIMCCFVLIIQRVNKDVYGYAVIALIGLTLLQIAFGNIPAEANWKTSLLGLLIAAIIIGLIVAFSIWIAPYLLQLGRG